MKGERPISRPVVLPIASSLAFAALLLLVADHVLQPVPVLALTATAGALMGFWLLPWAGWTAESGLTAGLALGISIHAEVHASRGSPSPAEEFTAHLLADAALGSGIALAAMSPALVGRILRQPGWSQRRSTKYCEPTRVEALADSM